MKKVKGILKNGEVRLYDCEESAWEAGAIIIYEPTSHLPRTYSKPAEIGGFELVGSDHTLRGNVYGIFKDKTGEIREIPPTNFSKLAVAQSWVDYDNNALKEKIESLNKELSWKQDYINDLKNQIDNLQDNILELQKIIAQVYLINEKAGPGSRKKARELMLPELENAGGICGTCGRPVVIGCECEYEEY